MKIYIPSTSRSDWPNVWALRTEAEERRHTTPGVSLNECDAAIILGDRLEMLREARACIRHHVPYVHVGAGCNTWGSWDQKVRAMLTAGCQKSWAYTEKARQNAECWSPWTGAHGFGVPVLDTLKDRKVKRKSYALVALNPVTAHRIGEELRLVKGIAQACAMAGREVVWSTPNEDPQGAKLLGLLKKTWPGRCLSDVLPHVPNTCRFAHAVHECAVIVGNSSAALIEAPVLGTPFVDVGCRQEGRPLAMGLTAVAEIAEAIAHPKPIESPSPYQHPQRKACEEIIKLAEEVGK